MEKIEVGQRIIVDYEYEASDGKRFLSEQSCQLHEDGILANKKIAEAEEKIKEIQHMELIPPLADEYYTYDWYYVKNSDDTKALADYYDEPGIEDLPVKQWICVQMSESGCTYADLTLATLKRDYNEFFNVFARCDG